MLNDVIDNDVTDNDVIDSRMNMHTLLASRPNVVATRRDALGVNGPLERSILQPFFNFPGVLLAGVFHCACPKKKI